MAVETITNNAKALKTCHALGDEWRILVGLWRPADAHSLKLHGAVEHLKNKY